MACYVTTVRVVLRRSVITVHMKVKVLVKICVILKYSVPQKVWDIFSWKGYGHSQVTIICGTLISVHSQNWKIM